MFKVDPLPSLGFREEQASVSTLVCNRLRTRLSGASQAGEHDRLPRLHPCQHPGTSATVQTGLPRDPRGCWDGVEARHRPLAWVPGEALQRPCHTLSTGRVLGSRTGGDCSPRAGLSSRLTPGRPEAEHTQTQPGSQAEYQAHIPTPLRARVTWARPAFVSRCRTCKVRL